MLLENLVSDGFINIIGLLIDQYGNEIGVLKNFCPGSRGILM